MFLRRRLRLDVFCGGAADAGSATVEAADGEEDDDEEEDGDSESCVFLPSFIFLLLFLAFPLLLPFGDESSLFLFLWLPPLLLLSFTGSFDDDGDDVDPSWPDANGRLN